MPSNNNVFNRFREKAEQANLPRGSKESIDWFRQTLRKNRYSFSRVTEGLKPGRFQTGDMITYQYDPKTKAKLKYYDTQPLIIVLDFAKGGWYGCNLHYLPPVIRASVLGEIINKKTPLAVARALERSEWSTACLKRYLSKQLLGAPVVVPKEEWDIAVSLPFESFQGKTQKSVWQESRRKKR